MSAVEPVGRLHVDQLRQALQSYDGCAEVAQRWGGLLADTFDRGGGCWLRVTVAAPHKRSI